MLKTTVLGCSLIRRNICGGCLKKVGDFWKVHDQLKTVKAQTLYLQVSFQSKFELFAMFLSRNLISKFKPQVVCLILNLK